MKFNIKNRWNGEVIFTAKIEATKDTPYSVQLGLAVKVAVKADAYLADAYLAGANLADAYLAGADLARADLAGANLADAYLAGADLARADLAGANLARADLARADLAGANLARANLAGVKIDEVTNARTLIVPEHGAFDGWKKCKDGVLVKLRVPAKAPRSNATGRKCRAGFVKVLDVIGAEVGISQHDGKTEYRKGETVHCDKWCEDRWQECAGGIHFFITRAEAEAY